MSHSSSRDGFTPSAEPPPQNAHVSPLNALSNPSIHSYAAPSSRSVLSNRLIPRDYLTSKSKSSAGGANGISARSSPFVNQSAFSLTSNAARLASDPSSDKDRRIDPDPTKSDIFRKDSADTSDKENTDVDDDLRLERTLSPESVVTSISADSSTFASRTAVGLTAQSQRGEMPRTSSIDSAISSVSASSQQRREHGDARDPSPGSIRGLITTAGSAENLVLHLLKEKNAAATQNNQLWKLVEKQRALLLGLNKDLERVTKDRDKYKKMLKEYQSQGTLPRAATQSPSREVAEQPDNAVKPPELPYGDRAPDHSTADSTPKDVNSPLDDAPGPAIITADEPVPTQGPGFQRPVLRAQTAALAQPSLSLTEPTPLTEKSNKGFSASRKAVPKPLNLMQKNNDPVQPAVMSPANRAMLADEDEDEHRGRRKTREEDDRDREKSLMKEQEARSKSAKKKSQPPAEGSEGQTVTAPSSVAVPLPSSPRPPQGLVPASALNASQGSALQMPLRSPGLPASPRPMHQPQFSALPMSPRAPPPGPLSPRAPKQPIPPPMMSPSPFADPAVIQRQNAMARQAAQQSYQPQDRLQVHEPTSSNEIPPVYQGLVSSQYPNLLLPPNALPSIQIKVASSHLRPSRHSMLGLRTLEDSTVFSLSVFSRASRNELWRIEKIPIVLPQLELQLRPRCKDLPRLPDKKLFSGHSPAIVDTRRQAIDQYFEDLLDMEMDEPSALIICKFLSTDVLDPSAEVPKRPGINQESLPQTTSLSGKVVKTGFLTKRGKNFGGWKSRYFVLDSPELRYFEAPGGPHLGTIKLQHSRIGSQKPEDPANTDPDDQYRHAFLIQEPKKKDSTTFVRHVLCAESDTDRDEWVSALLHYVEVADQSQSQSPASATSFPQRPTTASGRGKVVETQSNSPSPTSPVSFTEANLTEQVSRNHHISGPTNGAQIQDSTQWGSRPAPQQAPPREKEKLKMGNIFHFKKGSQEQLQPNIRPQEPAGKPRILRHNGYVRPVFGLPLAEAVEFCAPFNIQVPLPAVVYRSIEYLRYRKATNEEGLFRLSGSNIVIKTLKERFNTEGDVDLVDDEEHYDVHAVASLFKTYLRELPLPLLTRDLHIEFLRVLEMDTQADKVAAFNVLVHRLPTVNFHLLRAMSEYLLEVTENAAKNKMSIRNMGIVFSPTINIPTPVFNLFLSEFDAVFDRRPHEAASQPQIQHTELRAPGNLSPADIRSPRHQMFSDIPTPAYHQTNFSSEDPAAAPSKGHQSTGSGEFGFTPLHPSYENGQYVSHPQDHPRAQAFAPQASQHSQFAGEEQYGSLNRMLVPQGPITDKRRKRESAMLF